MVATTLDRWRTPGGAVGLAVALFAVAWLENGAAPWSPYYAVYAIAATVLALALGGADFGPLARVRWWHWPAGLALAVALQAVGGLFLQVVWPRLVGLAGGDPAAAGMPEALAAVFAAAAARLGGTPEGHQAAYVAAVVVWAGFGEEVFYRGYLQRTLRRSWGVLPAVLVANLLFAVRHAAQLALVEPYPWAAAASWVVFAFLVGLVFAWLYERTGSLWLPVFVHTAFNLIPALALLAG